MRWGLDQTIHTVGFVRGRSAFLFTSIIAVAALFHPSTGTLAKRLRIQTQRLAKHIFTSAFRSVEIVLALIISAAWLSPSEQGPAGDETFTYIGVASTIAMDLSLHKIIMGNSAAQRADISTSDCIDPAKALALDELGNVDPNSLWGRRLLRRRERAWLALFSFERG
jgi:hypothetical protein